MTEILPIATQGETVLTLSAQAVEAIDDPAIQQLIDQMLITMQQANGVGIAAPQVFHSKRIIIVASRPNKRYPYALLMEPTVMINPEILWQAPDTAKGWEGCLSVPGLRSQIERPKTIRVRYTSRTGDSIEAEFSDFVARIILHECDHLDGKLFLEHVINDSDLITEEEFQALFPT